MDTVKNTLTSLKMVKIDDQNSRLLKPVTTGQIFGQGNNFHPEGLFSTVVFGEVGTEGRSRTFGRIDLNTTLFHPLIYLTVISLKALYKDIISGTVTAEFDKKTGDFVKSTSEKAKTGFTFFLSHFEEMKFPGSDGEQRQFKIKLIKKAIKDGNYTTNYLLVMPAGMRDYLVDRNGRPHEDEINTFYRKVISQTTIIDPARAKKTPEVYDGVAAHIQRSIADLYDYIKTLIDGKNKLILDKWVGRKIFNSTRNVITSYVDKSLSIDDPRRLSYNHTLAGLHQFARAAAPLSSFTIKYKYIRTIFPDNSGSAYVVDKKTLKRVEVSSTSIQSDYDLWTSEEGLEKVIFSLGNQDLRNEPITVNHEQYYLALVYNDGKRVKIFNDIDELPEGWDRNKVSPVTLYEFIYMSIYHLDGKYPAFCTRYPITGYGSIYPSIARVTTTTMTDILQELDETWEPMPKAIAINFPRKGSDFVNSLVVHPSHLGALGADYDGDAMSFTMVLSDEAVTEINEYLLKKEYYLTDTGSFIFSNSTDTMNTVLAYITK